MVTVCFSLYVFTGKEGPVTAYDKDGVRVLLHFATDHPPGRPDVLVILVSMLNTAPLLVRNVVLQAAVPKVRGTKCLFNILLKYMEAKNRLLLTSIFYLMDFAVLNSFCFQMVLINAFLTFTSVICN